MQQGASTQELLPCPFCGGKGYLDCTGSARAKRGWYPTCATPNCPGVTDEQDEQGGTHFDYWTKAEAIAAWNTRIEHTPSDRNAETAPGQIERVMSSKWLDPECGEDGCQSRKWKQLYEQAVQGRKDFRQAYKEALTTTPEPTEPAEVAGLADELERLSFVLTRAVEYQAVPQEGRRGEGKVAQVWSNERPFIELTPSHDPKYASEAAELIALLMNNLPAILAALRTPPLLEVAKEALEEGADERGWLIETSFGPHIHYIGLCDPHGYWREQSEKGRHTAGRAALVGIIRFCKDANDACRFARKQDAQQLVDALGQLLTDPQICEHEWPASLQAIKGAEQ